MNNDKTKCDPCERDFQKNLDNIVREGRAPKGAAHDVHEKELKTAFGADDRFSSQHPTNPSTQNELKK